MWNRKEIKAKGKAAFKANYWASVLAAVIIITVALGSTAGVSFFAPSAGSVSLAANSTPAFATEETDEIPDLTLEDLDGLEEVPDLDLDELLESINSASESNEASEQPDIDSILNNPAILALISMAIGFLAILFAIVFILKILIFNPIEVAGYQFFKENALEKTSGLKFDFNNEYKNIVWGMFLRSIFVFLWSLLFIIPGIIKSYSYRMVPFILTDNPGITATEAITRSRQIMKGNKWRAFVLDLSFLGWYILSALTLGILSIFYVNPYVYATEAELYHSIKEN